jgi:hypothetical protein
MSFSQGEDGELVNTIVPNLSKQAILENQGLLVDGGQAKSLFISSSWAAAEALEWLREKLPKPFKWLDANISPSSLLASHQNRHTFFSVHIRKPYWLQA